MYHLICHTCQEETVFTQFEEAQDAFNEHVGNYHEVELQNIESKIGVTDAANEDAPTVEIDDNATTSDPSNPADK